MLFLLHNGTYITWVTNNVMMFCHCVELSVEVFGLFFTVGIVLEASCKLNVDFLKFEIMVIITKYISLFKFF